MDVKKAASNLKLLVQRHFEEKTPLPARSEDGRGVGHALWMLCQIEEGEIQGEKAHRWLGDAAGMLRTMQVVDLEGCKYANLFS